VFRKTVMKGLLPLLSARSLHVPVSLNSRVNRLEIDIERAGNRANRAWKAPVMNGRQ
jgi:hypothetical protein